MDELIKQIYAMRQKKEDYEKDLEQLKTLISDLDKSISNLSDQLLSQMQSANMTEYMSDDIVAVKFKRSNIGYTDDSLVLKYLKDNYQGQYIRTKISESLDKIALKKAIKDDSKLADDLNSMIIDKSTEYVVVTSKDSYDKMKGHIDNDS